MRVREVEVLRLTPHGVAVRAAIYRNVGLLLRICRGTAFGARRLDSAFGRAA